MNIKNIVFLLIFLLTAFSCRSMNYKEKEFYVTKGSLLKIGVDVTFNRWCNFEGCPNFHIGHNDEDDGISPFSLNETIEITSIKIEIPTRDCEHEPYAYGTRQIRQTKYFRKHGRYKISYPKTIEEYITITQSN